MRRTIMSLSLLLALLLPIAAVPPAHATPTTPAPAPAPYTAPQPQAVPPGGFLEVSGSQITRLGQPVIIKGVNYYPQGRPWEAMWQYWDGPQMERELRLARDQLGINVVRILVPYDYAGRGRVNRKLLERMRQFLQIAGNLDLRVNVTLFDFYDTFPRPGTREFERDLNYVRTFVGNFIGDERIFAWDVHNEPDNYGEWRGGNAQQVLYWLGAMADEIKRVAPYHLVTVGMAHYDNVWQAGPDGRRVIDYSDIVSVHIYNAADAARQLDEIRKYTDKPILLQEFGWPTGAPCTIPEYNEEQQAWMYRTMREQTAGRVAGVIAWTLRDYDPGPHRRWDNREEHYGLYRPDDSLKPAAYEFMQFPATPLPTITRTNVEIYSDRYDLTSKKDPIQTESGKWIKDWFREAWTHLGGRGSFGLPISEAYEHPDGYVVQYFQAGALRLNGNALLIPGFDQWPIQSQTMEAIKPINIGEQYLARAGLAVPPPPPPPPLPTPPDVRYFPETGYSVAGKFLEFYDTFSGPWRLGLPISGELVEQVGDVQLTTQYFQNGRLEFNPQYNAVQFGQIGYAMWDSECRFEQ